MVRSPLPRCLRGYTYIGLLFLVFMVGMGLSVASHWWHMEAKRAREQELLFVGEEFRKAIASYHATAVGTPQYPKSLEDLVEDNRLPTPIRHLRRVYIDPVTGEAGWELIKEQDRIIGVNSRSKEVPIKVAGFPERYEEFSAATTYTQWRFVHRVTAKSSPGDPSTPTPGNQPLTQPPGAQGNRPSSRLRGEHRGRDEEFGQQAACSSSGVPVQRNARAASEEGMNQRFIRAIVLAVTLAASFHAYAQSIKNEGPRTFRPIKAKPRERKAEIPRRPK